MKTTLSSSLSLSLVHSHGQPNICQISIQQLASSSYQSNIKQLPRRATSHLFCTSVNGSICLLVQFLGGPEVEPLTGLVCISKCQPAAPSPFWVALSGTTRSIFYKGHYTLEAFKEAPLINCVVNEVILTSCPIPKFDF